MPLPNRVDPFGDLHAVPNRGLLTGNRGCLVDDDGQFVRHHRGRLWIACVPSYRGWRSPLDAPGHWTPLFFLDDAVALAAGHRPCGLCRRSDYQSYQSAASTGLGRDDDVLRAPELDARLAKERLRPGRGRARATDRKTWCADIASLPAGTVYIDRQNGQPRLLLASTTLLFGFGGWGDPQARSARGEVQVLTPPTSVLALTSGFVPMLHPTATPG